MITRKYNKKFEWVENYYENLPYYVFKPGQYDSIVAMQSYFYLLARIDIWGMNWKGLCIWMKTQKWFLKSVQKLKSYEMLNMYTVGISL